MSLISKLAKLATISSLIGCSSFETKSTKAEFYHGFINGVELKCNIYPPKVHSEFDTRGLKEISITAIFPKNLKRSMITYIDKDKNLLVDYIIEKIDGNLISTYRSDDPEKLNKAQNEFLFFIGKIIEEKNKTP